MMHARMRAGGARPAPPATTVCVRPSPQPARPPCPSCHDCVRASLTATRCPPTCHPARPSSPPPCPPAHTVFPPACPHNQLREKENRLSELVDGVVEGYHSGFARSIQNYSLILQVRGGPPPHPRWP